MRPVEQLKSTYNVGDNLSDGTPQSEGLHSSEMLQSNTQGTGYNEARSKCFYTSECNLWNS